MSAVPDLMAALEESLSATPADAIFPGRALILSEAEQRKLAAAMDYLSRGDDLEAGRLHRRITRGDQYANEVDELARLTLDKRTLEETVRRINGRITELDPQVVDQLVDQGHSKVTHDATGAALAIDSKIWAKVDLGDVDLDELPKSEQDLIKADAKAKAGDALITAGLGHYVRSDFNLNSVSAHFREEVKAYRAEQKALPEDQRVPRDVSTFLPEQLQGVLRLDDTPTIRVTAARS